jgi:uncharacterized RDD family membrane protein YckC
MSSNRVEAGEAVEGDLKAVMGSNTVEGSVSHDVVAVMGGDVIDGSVGHDVTAVMGSVVVNGSVGHNVQAVMGSVTLGPKAVVRGDVISIGGTVHRSPGAIVRGRIVSQAFGAHGAPWGPTVDWNHDHGGRDWAESIHGFFHAWRWVFTLVALGLYALLALLFPGAVQRCGSVLEHRPVLTILTALNALLAVPLVFILMLITIIGIPVAVVLLPAGILLCAMVGKAGIYWLIGRSLSGGRLPPAGAVLLGGALCAVFYFVPILGLLIGFFVTLLGFGCGLAALLTSREERPPLPPAPAPAPAPAPVPDAVAVPAAPAPAATEAVPPAAAAAPAAGAPAPVDAAALPRAGFWIRMAALFIDAVIVSAACGSLFAPHFYSFTSGIHLSGVNEMLPLAAYGAIMWKFKGTTIGGMIFGLRVVRLDGKPVEWETVIVRALACFLSTFLWLGFIWIAFDGEKQSWHDKIAGTVVIRTPGVSLV